MHWDGIRPWHTACRCPRMPTTLQALPPAIQATTTALLVLGAAPTVGADWLPRAADKAAVREPGVRCRNCPRNERCCGKWAREGGARFPGAAS